MSDTRKTLVFVAAAALLAVGAAVVRPRHRPPELFSDEGQLFTPDFKDPLKATALEVWEFDEATATARIFRVEFKNGKWVIPSHHNYPADAKDRLAKVAGAVMDLRKDTIRSDRVQDHEAFGVIDPRDGSATATKGRGKRVTLSDADGKVLADFIFGRETRDGSGMRYVRLPDQKRAYGVKVKAEISTKFEDWIETDLLKIDTYSVRRIVIDNYSIDEEAGRIKNRATYTLLRDDGSAPWTMGELKPEEEVNKENVDGLVRALDDLRIVGVRRKPASLTRELKRAEGMELSMADVLSLRQRGFFVTREGDLLSNEGELDVRCEDGVIYTLRFGEILVGAGEALTAGTDEPKKDPKDKKEGTENRYLFVTTRFDESLLPAPPPAFEEKDPGELKPDPAWTEDQKKAEEEKHKKAKEEYTRKKEEHDRKKKERDDKVAAGRKRSDELTNRFADWYYVISADLFKKLRRGREDLARKKEPPKDVLPPPPDKPK